MATHLKRLTAGVVAVVALGIGTATVAGAQTASTFSSPVSSPASQPIWIRSITPCPKPTSGVTSFVEAQLLQAVTLAPGEKVWGHVRDDGSWDVTLPAPAGPSGGATGRYLVEVQCGTTLRPPLPPGATEALSTITQEYVSRVLEVTSGAATGAEWVDGPLGGAATTTTSTTVPDEDEEEDTDEAGDLEVPGVTSAGAVAEEEASELTAASVSPAGPSTEEIRAEIAKRATAEDEAEYLAQAEEDGVPLFASPASAARRSEESSGAIPAWSFACAAMLAVGAVIAWGQRRSASVEIDE